MRSTVFSQDNQDRRPSSNSQDFLDAWVQDQFRLFKKPRIQWTRGGLSDSGTMVTATVFGRGLQNRIDLATKGVVVVVPRECVVDVVQGRDRREPDASRP